MKVYKYLILIIIPISGLFLYSCESNDSPLNSVYIPKAVNKKVLVEFFTNSGCAPCVEVHKYYDEIKAVSGITVNDTSVILVTYHYRFPYPGDSLYLSNKSDNDKRASFYSIGFTPNVWLDGIYMEQFSYSNYTSKLDAEMLQSVNYANMTFENTFESGTDSGTLKINIDLIKTLPSTDNKLYALITENGIHYNASNGLSEFDDVARDIITNNTGDDIVLINGMNVIYKGYKLNTKWNEDNCYITVFVQSVSTKEVYFADRIKIK